MKRIACLLIVVMLIFSLSACSKKVKADDNNQPENPIEEVETPEPDDDVAELFYVLYLKQKSSPYIFPDSFTIMEDDYRLIGKSLEEFVVEELIKQKDIDELMNPIPEGTRVLSIVREGNTVILDLSEEFKDIKGTKEDVEATVAIIVNSLTTLPGIDKVKILVEGEELSNLRGVDLREALEFIDTFYIEK